MLRRLRLVREHLRRLQPPRGFMVPHLLLPLLLLLLPILVKQLGTIGELRHRLLRLLPLINSRAGRHHKHKTTMALAMTIGFQTILPTTTILLRPAALTKLLIIPAQDFMAAILRHNRRRRQRLIQIPFFRVAWTMRLLLLNHKLLRINPPFFNPKPLCHKHHHLREMVRT